MSRLVIEGTWEEIERHKAEFPGHLLRLTIMPERSAGHQPEPLPASNQPKELVGYGAFRGVFGGEVVTSDHHEFDPLVPLGITHINFLR